MGRASFIPVLGLLFFLWGGCQSNEETGDFSSPEDFSAAFQQGTEVFVDELAGSSFQVSAIQGVCSDSVAGCSELDELMGLATELLEDFPAQASFDKNQITLQSEFNQSSMNWQEEGDQSYVLDGEGGKYPVALRSLDVGYMIRAELDAFASVYILLTALQE